MLCCFVCGDSRESLDPSDQYPDMGTWVSVPVGYPRFYWTTEFRQVWKCDQCAREEVGYAV